MSKSLYGIIEKTRINPDIVLYLLSFYSHFIKSLSPLYYYILTIPNIIKSLYGILEKT